MFECCETCQSSLLPNLVCWNIITRREAMRKDWVIFKVKVAGFNCLKTTFTP